MRVCLLSGEFPPMQGGVGDFTREIGLELNGLGAEVSVITSKAASEERQLLADGSCTVERDGSWLRLFPVVDGWNFSSWAQVSELLERTRARILNIQYQTAAYHMHPAINLLPWRLRLGRKKPKIVATFHDLKLPYLFPKAGPLRRWVTQALVRWSDAVIVTNVEDKALAERYGAHEPYLLPIGSNIAPQEPPGYRREAWRQRWGVEHDEILLCYFGFLNESKGGETLFRALSQLIDSGERVKLLMIGGRVGSSDPSNIAYLEKVERLIAELGLENRVMWTGFVDRAEVSASFWASDLCVLPYRDGVSFRRGTLMAALAHGMPIISTHPRVEIPEIVEDENMALVAPEDPEGLAGKIRELAASPHSRSRLGRGAARLSSRFTWTGIAQRTLELYETVLEGKDRVAGRYSL